MTDDIVQLLRTETVYCEACNIFPCTKKVGMFNVDATPADCDCECHDLARKAANEIEDLRAYCHRHLACAEEWQDDYRALVALVNAWAEADIAWADAPESWEPDAAKKFTDAVMALRKAMGR